MSRQVAEFFGQAEPLQAYLHGLTQAAGHADRVVPIENYTKGLMLPIECKSVEPMAARLAPATYAGCTSCCITSWLTRPGAMTRS